MLLLKNLTKLRFFNIRSILYNNYRILTTKASDEAAKASDRATYVSDRAAKASDRAAKASDRAT